MIDDIFEGFLNDEDGPTAGDLELARQRDADRLARERAERELEEAERARAAARRADMNDPRNWTDEQRRIAGMDPGTSPRIAEEQLPMEIQAARAASMPVRPARPVSEVEAERANRFRETAELERAMRTAQRAAEVLAEAEQILGRARELAKELGDEARIKEAEDLETRLQAIEDSVEQSGG